MKILAQESSWLDKMIQETTASAPKALASWLEGADAALFSRLKGEEFGGGRRFSVIRLDGRAIVTTLGVVSFKRRYCRDLSTGRLCHPFDEAIGLSPRSRMSDEMRLRIVDGVSSHGKRRELEHRVLVSGVDLGEVAKRINSALSEVFGLGDGDSVFLSGDLAPYIRSFGERLDFASEYAPDKWHIAHFLSTGDRPVGADGVLGRLEGIERTGDLTGLSDDAVKVYRLWAKDKSLFDAWGDPEYLGCCQEAMNSHYYAARFGKLGGRFKRETVEKLALVAEARLNG